jgi:hypothetical protein
VNTLDILLDIEKLYPLISRPQAEGGNVSLEKFFRNKILWWVSITMGLNSL